MLADPVTAYLDNGSDPADSESYAIISQNGTNTVRRNNTAEAGAPKLLEISHQIVGKGTSARARHMIRFKCYGLVDGVEDVTKVASMYTVADIPQLGFTSSQIEALAVQLAGFLRGIGGTGADAFVPATVFERWVGGES